MDTLKSVVMFTAVAVGATLTLPHNLKVNGIGYAPDSAMPGSSGCQIVSANRTSLTVMNNGPAAADLLVLCELWHPIERQFGRPPDDGSLNEHLSPQPFVPNQPLATVGEINVTTFGAKGDGVTDDTDAIQRAFNAAAETVGGSFGAYVFFPRGTYMSLPTLKLPNGVGIRGDGTAGSCIMQIPGSSGTALVENLNQTGGQEYAFFEKIRFDGSADAGGVCTVAVVNIVSVFVNSYMRDVTILNSSSVGLRLAAADGMGPIKIENLWIAHTGSHGAIAEELAGNSDACAGLYFEDVTIENWGANASALYLKGIGSSGNYKIDGLHIEHGGAEAGLTGVTFDGVSHVRARNIQLQAGTPANYTQGILITAAAQNVDIDIDDVTNINVINPVLRDLAYNGILAGQNIPRYVTPDVTVIGGMRFAPATNNTTANAPNVALAFTAHDGGNIFSAVYPGAGGGVLRWVYTTSGISIMQWGTDGKIFVYEPMTFQKGLRGFASRLAAPSGAATAGDVVFYTDPVAGGFVGRTCITTGNPGTWKDFGAIQP